jgi:hypothetical protein
MMHGRGRVMREAPCKKRPSQGSTTTGLSFGRRAEAAMTSVEVVTPRPQPSSGGRRSRRGRAALTRKAREHSLKASAAAFTPTLTPGVAPFQPPLMFPLSATPGIMPWSWDQAAAGAAPHQAHPAGAADRHGQAAPHWPPPSCARSSPAAPGRRSSRSARWAVRVHCQRGVANALVRAVGMCRARHTW